MEVKYIGTIRFYERAEQDLTLVYEKLDGKELYAGREVGRSGYKHYQFCMDCSGDLEKFVIDYSLGWHVERAVDWESSKNYCRKTNDYLYLGNSIEERSHRWNERRSVLPIWRTVIAKVVRQNDRQITVWIDRKGGVGKSSLFYILARRGIGFPIPRSDCTPTRLLDFIASKYNNEKVILIDLPRSRKIDVDLAEVLEDVKDGLIASAKYQGTTKFIKGVKVLVATNHLIEYSAYNSLTIDRWDLIVDGETGVAPKRTRKKKTEQGDVSR